jgi:alkylation response protein AidB-like acyl-CoA dehydrogenase
MPPAKGGVNGEAEGISLSMVDGAPDELPDYIKHAARSCPEPLKTARELRPIIEAGAAEGERLAYVPDDVIRALCDAGVWGLKVPRRFGGEEVDARTYIDVIEELSYADGSTGWTVMAGNFAGGVGAVLGPSAAEHIYGGQDGIISATQISALGKAERVEGGYHVTEGHFHFGSASRYASWFGGAFAVEDKGKPVLDDHGRPKVIMCFTSRDKVRIKENWDVMGLAATGSYDFDLVDQDIPDDWVAGLPGRPFAGGPIHMVGVSMAHAAWALGVGRRALEEIHQLAFGKRRFQRTTLIDQPRFQLEYGRQLAAMRAARALVYEAFDRWYQAATLGPVGIEIRADARLAACWATEIAVGAAHFAMLSAGSDGVRNRDGSNTLQRVFRDMQTGATHRHIDQDVLIECSQVNLGVADPALQL